MIPITGDKPKGEDPAAIPFLLWQSHEALAGADDWEISGAPIASRREFVKRSQLAHERIEMDAFVLLKLLSGMIFPPASTAFGVFAGLLLSLRFPKTGRSLVVLFILQSVILSLPIVADALVGPLEAQAKIAARERSSRCCYDYIVLLGGGVVPASPPTMPTSHLIEGADRVIYAAQLFRDGVAPRIVVSGGSMPNAISAGESEADAMQALLLVLGVPLASIVRESSSSNTLQNIALVQNIVGAAPVALVTSAYHMPRSLKLARRLNLNAAAFPTDWRVPWTARSLWHNWLPTVDALSASTIALKEYLAIAFDFREPDAK